MRDFQTCYNESRDVFARLFQKPLENTLGGIITQTEGNGEVGNLLDTYAGIDAILQHPKYGLLGIAVRIQYDCHYRTFTIRQRRESQIRTEYAKWQDAYIGGGLVSKFIFQGYVNRQNGSILHAAVAKSEDIYDCIRQGFCGVSQTGEQQQGRASFFIVDWDTLRQSGKWLYEFPLQLIDNKLCQSF